MRWPVADPDAKRDCGHRRCARSILAAALLCTAGGAVVAAAVTYAIATPGQTWPAPAAVTGLLIGIAGAAAACWPHPAETDADLEALIDATREFYVPTAWEKEFRT